MTTVEAVYEHGVLRPVNRVELPEGTRVRLEITTSDVPEEDRRPAATSGPRRRSRLLAGFGAVTPTREPEDWQAVRKDVEQAIADEATSQS